MVRDDNCGSCVLTALYFLTKLGGAIDGAAYFQGIEELVIGRGRDRGLVGGFLDSKVVVVVVIRWKLLAGAFAQHGLKEQGIYAVL